MHHFKNMHSLNICGGIDGLIFQITSFGNEMGEVVEGGNWLPLLFSLISSLWVGVGTEFLSNVFLIGRLEEALGKGLRIISLFAFIVATIVVMYGGYQIRTGNADAGKMSILGGLVIGLAVIIVTSIFEIAGLPVLKVAK